MPSKSMVFYGDSRLSKVTEEIKRVDYSTRKLSVDLIDTMRHYHGQGISANQIGSDQAMCIIDLDKKLHIILNPLIIQRSDETNTGIEGCLSIPGYIGSVERDNRITVEYKDIKGQKKILKASGLLSRVLQHEIDHLCGILFLQRVVPGSLQKVPV